MKPVRNRRIKSVRLPRRRTRFVFQDDGEDSDVVAARIREMIESGRAHQDDRFITLRWAPPADEKAGD